MSAFMKDRTYLRVAKDGTLVEDNDPVLRDGQVLHVPMMMTDAAPKATDYQVVADAHAAKTGVQSRSGSYTADQQRARDERQAAYDKRLAGQWKTDNSEQASEVTPEQEAAAKAQGEKDAAERAASPNAGYDRRISNAWKDAPVVADGSKLTATMNVLGAHSTESGFKQATAAGDPPALDAARKRYHQRLEAAYQKEAL